MVARTFIVEGHRVLTFQNSQSTGRPSYVPDRSDAQRVAAMNVAERVLTVGERWRTGRSRCEDPRRSDIAALGLDPMLGAARSAARDWTPFLGRSAVRAYP